MLPLPQKSLVLSVLHYGHCCSRFCCCSTHCWAKEGGPGVGSRPPASSLGKCGLQHFSPYAFPISCLLRSHTSAPTPARLHHASTDPASTTGRSLARVDHWGSGR